MANKEVQFAQFHTINEFMIDEYRVQVLQDVLGNLDKIPHNKKAVAGQIKRHVKIPGFRNSNQAPLPLKVKGAVKTYKNNPEFVAHILSGWAELHQDLSRNVYNFLASREWELLPLETDRTKLPGFMITWPEDESFDVLTDAYLDYDKDEQQQNDDDIRLMIVWLSTRLPYQISHAQEENTSQPSD